MDTIPVSEIIPLAGMLAELRKELLQAQEEGEDSALKFQIEDIEIELQVTATQAGEGGVGIKFWVLSADAKGKAAEAKTQKLKLKLKPVHAEDRTPFEVGDADELPG
jgi:hypothetical protein